MYTVKVYTDDIIIETVSFNTLMEAFKYANKYCFDYFTDINDVPYHVDDFLYDES